MLKYFSYIAEPYFITAPSGERLFISLDVFWSKPYIIPDPETEKRLFRKLLQMWLIFFTILIVSQPFLFIAMPNVAEEPIWTSVYIAVIICLLWLTNWLVFRKDLRDLKRFNKRIPFHAYYLQESKRQSTPSLIFSFLVCIGFTMAGFRVLKDGFNPFVSWLGIITLGLGAGLCAYLLWLKLVMPRNRNTDTTYPKTEA